MGWLWDEATTQVVIILRNLGWWLIDWIYGFINSLYDILCQINLIDIIGTMSNETVFRRIYSYVFVIALSLLALFSIISFIKKIIDPDENPSILKIIKDIGLCTLLILFTTVIFTRATSTSSVITTFVENQFNTYTTSLSTRLLSPYVQYTKDYSERDSILTRNNFYYILKLNEFANFFINQQAYIQSQIWTLKYGYDNEEIVLMDIPSVIETGTFTDQTMYNDTYAVGEKVNFVFDIDWLSAIIVGLFFIYCMFYAGIMLARRQVEFIFLMLISPIAFATSIGNKQRRTMIYENLVSLFLQAVSIMLVFNITILFINQINDTTFFCNDSTPITTFSWSADETGEIVSEAVSSSSCSDPASEDIVMKAILYIASATFLLTSSQMITKFIGANVSASAGREQMMAMGGFGRFTTGMTLGTGLIGGGLATLGAGKLIGIGAKKAGNYISSSTTEGTKLNYLGSFIQNHHPVQDTGRTMMNMGTMQVTRLTPFYGMYSPHMYHKTVNDYENLNTRGVDK